MTRRLAWALCGLGKTLGFHLLRSETVPGIKCQRERDGGRERERRRYIYIYIHIYIERERERESESDRERESIEYRGGEERVVVERNKAESQTQTQSRRHFVCA